MTCFTITTGSVAAITILPLLPSQLLLSVFLKSHIVSVKPSWVIEFHEIFAPSEDIV